ncbi:MAG: hypothetical protein LBQ22_13160 [Bacteroidales bacterium]|jgi:hypothetical protein|nr:hypothetical protein [Bacteroidales bacterium]
MNNIILIVIIIICFLIIGRLIYTRRKEKVRYDENMNVLFLQNYSLETRNGQLANQVKTLRLTVDEFEKYVPELKSEIHNLKIKLKRVESISQITTKITDTIKVPIKDTVILTDSLKTFSYNDEFTNISGKIFTDSLDLSYSVFDSIIQVVHKGKYQKWHYALNPFRKRPLVQTITTKNPNTTILYNRHIVIEKK